MRHRIARTLLVASVLGAVVGLSGVAQAQGPRGRRGGGAGDSDPDYWVGLSVGFVDGVTINDGKTASTWAFGYSPQISATFEKKLQAGVTAGISAGFSTAPLTYTSYGSNGFSSGCFGSCQAKADVTQYLAFIRGGGGRGFHFTYNFEAGATSFANFRATDGDISLEPTSAIYDFTAGFGGGLGYGISSTAEVYANEVLDFVLHSQSGTTASSAPRMNVIRAGARIGF